MLSYLHFLIVDVGSKKGWLKKVSADRRVYNKGKGTIRCKSSHNALKQQKYTDQNPYGPSGSSGAAPAADLPVEETSLSGCCEQSISYLVKATSDRPFQEYRLNKIFI